MVGGSYGPSTGRVVEVGEPSETRVKMRTTSLPPVMGVVVALLVFFAVVFGTVLIYDGSELLGCALFLIAGIAAVVYFLSWRGRRE